MIRAVDRDLAGPGNPRSEALYERATAVSVGGVHGASRFYAPQPLFWQRMDGPWVWDADGHQYLDLAATWGTAVLGHNDPEVRESVISVLASEGVHFGPPSEREVELAEYLVGRIASADLIAFHGGGGSDPLYVGFRLARALTGRSRLLKFEGEYHGWHDPLAVSVHPSLDRAGPSEAPQPVPVSAGAAEGATSAIIGCLNDIPLLEALFDRWGKELACAVVAPVNHSCGCIPLDAEFLATLRALCTEYDVILMFDEILTGFRHSTRGAQDLVGVLPDLTAFGKAMANGFQIAALAGRRELMTELTPLGKAFYSGTYNAHLLSIAAAQRTVRRLDEDGLHERLFALGKRVSDGINDSCSQNGIHAVCQHFGSVFCVYFGHTEVRGWRDVASSADGAGVVNRRYWQALLDAGIFMHPYIANRCFISAAHTPDQIDRVVDVTTDFMIKNRDAINHAGAHASCAT